MIHPNILSAVGHTPLVKLNKLVGPDDATVLVKCEFMNPGGAIKDRMAMHILEKAVREGRLKPGGTIVENTSGNTGMGVALYPTLAKGETCATIEIKMSYFRAVPSGVVRCETTVLNRGRTIANLDSRLYVGDTLVAQANGNYAILKPRTEAAVAAS